MSLISDESSLRIQVRQARVDDVPGLIRLHMECFSPKEHLLMLFGERALRSIYHWFVASPETFTVVGTSGNAIVGLCTVCRTAFNRPMVRHNASALLIGALTHPRALFHPAVVARLRTFVSATNKPASVAAESSSPAQLGFLAVHREFHGTQTGELLVRAAVEGCRRRCWKGVRAGIYKDNLPARFMYAKLGFKKNTAISTDELTFVELD